MIKQTILAALLLFSLNCFSQTTIYMEKSFGVYMVPCTVNGVKLKFIFDTGASDVSISLTEALFMRKNGFLKSDDIKGKERYTDATGEISVGTKIILSKIEFAGLTLKNVEASIVNTLDAPLLLGQSAISKLGKIQLEGNKLTIFDAKSSLNSGTTKANLTQCPKYMYSTYLANTLSQYMYIFSDKTYTDETKRLVELPEKANILVLEENTGDEQFFYVCYNGIKGYISRHLLIKED